MIIKTDFLETWDTINDESSFGVIENGVLSMPSQLQPQLYSYIRFSTVEQEKGQSFNRQLSYAKEVAQEKGLELDDSLSMKDLGLSAYHKANITRGALGIFLAAVERGRVPVGSILVIESLDRISRAEPLESQGIVAQIINAGITVITAVDRKEYNRESIKANPMDLVYIILILIRANEESETKSIRVRSTLTKQCEDWISGKRGFKVKCGKPPKWLSWHEKCVDSDKCETCRDWSSDTPRFVFNSKEQAIILRKIELFKKGYGGLKIAELLNQEFGAGTVHHTGANVYREVKRPSLIGELHVKVGETEYVLEDYYPPVISQDEFEQIQADSVKRGAVRHSQKFVGILSGIGVFQCGECNKSVGSHVIYRNKNIDDVKSSHKRYGCVEARRKNLCSMSSTVQIDIVENAVVRFCQDQVNLRRILLQERDLDTFYAEEESLTRRLKSIERDIEKLMKVLLSHDEDTPQAIINSLKKLEKEADSVRGKVQRNKNKLVKIKNTHTDEVSERWLALTGNLSQADNDVRLRLRQLVKDTFKSITLNTNKTSYSSTGAGLDHLINMKLTGGHSNMSFELTLEFHNGNKRVLILNKHSGQLLSGFDLQ